MKKNINSNWYFTKDRNLVTKEYEVTDLDKWEPVSLPHTWNGRDGQDGGNDYYRGTCCYTRSLKGSELGQGDTYIEFLGANSSAEVYINGKKAGSHEGGYSTFRFNITGLLEEENTILVLVDNGVNNRIYPQVADFTFYGGIYRDVNILNVPKVRFDLDYCGGDGIMVSPAIVENKGVVDIDTFVTGDSEDWVIEFSIWEDEKEIWHSAGVPGERQRAEIENPRLWNGIKDPFCYRLRAVLRADGEEDIREVRFGIRSFEIDPDKGFMLNGESYPLRGVCRHQDRPDIGNALSATHHNEDIELIMEMGANTIRLAHYQHSGYFYDLCDEKGLVIWAEIPYISNHMPEGRENTISQMKELIVQNYNHPSIVVWGLSNEITMKGADDKDLIENHRILNDLCHEMDKTRLTTMAVVSMCPTDAEYLDIPDCLSWNHYFGWYGGDTSMNGGDTSMNGPWLDKFHKEHPNTPVGVSEYGCEALNWHSSTPFQGDYTEEYQAYYHEELIKQLYTRDYLWATHVWNMFDFAADARAEGGEDGMNHKGLVTFDRKYKKDAFYAYKAWLSGEPFVHICGKRYIKRAEDITRVTVYSNLPKVALYADGELLEEKESGDHFFYFDVPNKGRTELEAVAGECKDASFVEKVDKLPEEYVMKESGDILNWFEIEQPDGYLSIMSTMGEAMKHSKAMMLIGGIFAGLKDEKAAKGPDSGNPAAGFEMGNIMTDKNLRNMLGGFAIKRMLSMAKMAGYRSPSREELLELNRKLNKIKK